MHIIYNGIDLAEYQPVTATDALERYGIDPAVPFVLFVGRITRQKGIVHLVNAIQYLDPGIQVVLCAGAPDTPEIAAGDEGGGGGRAGRSTAGDLDRGDGGQATVYQLYTHAAVFCCPSIYEPFGIINLEAMACETAVVASAVGGIKEVVVEGETGFLVPLEQQQESPFEPLHPDQFSRDLAARINRLMADPELRERMGKAGRRRAEQHFSWKAIAQQTRDLYAELLGRHRAAKSATVGA